MSSPSLSSASSPSRLARIFNTDFCPGLNRYVMWLKEPIGWFVVAAAASALVGAILNPIGWALSVGLLAIVALGLAFPWLATRFTRCEIRVLDAHPTENEAFKIEVTIHNRLPFPIWGLHIEDLLSHEIEHSSKLADEIVDVTWNSDIALHRVPACCVAKFQLTLHAQFRGNYPQLKPKTSCAFPFGLWKSTRTVASCESITVWPQRFSIETLWDQAGSSPAEMGLGNRLGSAGDFLGVRAFRNGDSLRNIHWPQTARTNQLVVCERGGPEQSTVRILIDARRIRGSRSCVLENVACRTRMAASVVQLLHTQRIPFELHILGDESLTGSRPTRFAQAMDALAQVPLYGYSGLASSALGKSSANQAQTQFSIGANQWDADSSHPESKIFDASRSIHLSLASPSGQSRHAGLHRRCEIDWRQDIRAQLLTFLTCLHPVPEAA